MAKFNWMEITKEDVERAILKFLEDTPEYPEPKSTFLVYEGRKLPAKHIRGMAYTEHYGKAIRKEDFGGGKETARFFERLGFNVEYNGKISSVPDTNDIPEDLISDDNNLVREVNLKVLMYLQTENVWSKRSFKKDMKLVKNTEADILVFPEVPWLPFNDLIEESDILLYEDRKEIFNEALELSREVDKAVVICGTDMYGTIFSVFANAEATEDETSTAFYIKHTMTDYSAFEIEEYDKLCLGLFTPIKIKDYLIGLTICYDCNHSLFSRMYGLQDVDLIINSTGGNVQYNKWYKYNQVRAIENLCYNLCTMGMEDYNENSYVFGFNPNGKELKPVLINGESEESNYPGGLYLYDLSLDDMEPGIDASINQSKTVSKKQDFYIPVGKIDKLLNKAECLETDLYLYKHENANIVIAVVYNEDIFAAERVLSLLYSKKLKGIKNKKYLLVAKEDNMSVEEYEQYISATLKVRSMENFCAVLLESDTINECYQTGYTRAAQVVQAENNMFGLDLNRMGGPEVIWKNKPGMKAAWRNNFEVLIEKALELRDSN